MPSTARKRLRMPEADAFDSPLCTQNSPTRADSPDIIAEFAARAGRVETLQQDLIVMKQKAKKQADALGQVTSDLASLRAEHSRLSALSQAEVNQERHARSKVQSQLQTELRRVAELERQLNASKSAQEQSNAQSSMNDSGQHAMQHQPVGASEERLLSDIKQLKRELKQRMSEADERIDRLRHDKQLADNAASANEAYARELMQQLETALKDCSKAETAAAAAQRNAAATELKAAMVPVTNMANAAKASAVTELANVRAELNRMEREVCEAHKLRQYVTNSEVLREKLRAAEARAERAEASLQEATVSHPLTKSDVEHQLNEWTTFYQGVADVKTPQDVLHRMQQLQKDAVAQSEHLASAAAALETTQSQLTQAEDRLHVLEDAAASARQAETEANASKARLEIRLKLLERECSGLNRMIATYRQDSKDDAAKERSALTAAQGQTTQDMVHTLRQQIAEVEASLNAKIAERAALEATVAEAKGQAAAAEAQAAQADVEADRLGNQVADLQKRLGRGEFNQETTRVLHWVRNPEAERQREDAAARIAELELENSALHGQLQQLGSDTQQQHQQQQQPIAGQLGLGVSGIQAAMADKEIALSKQKIADLEKSIKRLKEVFNAHITTFRTACYFLFGYNIEMAAKATSTAHSAAAPTVYTLTPSGGDANTQLKFASLANNSGLKLLPSPYLDKLKQEVETFIGRFRSIPAFLANLTMEHFQKDTRH